MKSYFRLFPAFFAVLVFFSIPLSSIAQTKGELTLVMYPSPKGIDWSSPRSLVASALYNALSPTGHSLKHSIGHVTVLLNCEDTEGQKHSFHTGMTSSNNTEDYRLLLVEEVGLGILLHRFEGRLQSTSEINEDVRTRFRSGDMSWLTYLISQETCGRLAKYMEEYREHGDSAHYGLRLRPRYGEGGGCSAFATSFLELAGLMEDEFVREWKTQRKIPLSLIGGPTTGKKLNLWDIYTDRDAWEWAKPGVPQTEIDFWDPEKMHQWVLEKWEEESRRGRPDYIVQKKGRARGLKIDVSHIRPPADAIWKVRR